MQQWQMQQSQMQQIHQLSDQDGWTVMSQNAKKLLQVTLTFATKMSKTASPCQKCLCPAPSGTRNSQMSDKEDWISNRVNQYFRGKKVWIIINNENSEKRGLHRAISS